MYNYLFYSKDLNIKGIANDILSYLLQNIHCHPISRDKIGYTLWDEPELILRNTIGVNINKIRKKLKQWFGINMINTIRKKAIA